jgi:hypothetical protein
MKMDGWVVFDLLVAVLLWVIILYMGAHLWAWGYRIWQLSQ